MLTTDAAYHSAGDGLVRVNVLHIIRRWRYATLRYLTSCCITKLRITSSFYSSAESLFLTMVFAIWTAKNTVLHCSW